MDRVNEGWARTFEQSQTLILLGILALLGAMLLALATPLGLGLSPDSTVYVGAARSLVNGHGYSLPAQDGGYAPIAHYPPLYSIVLAASDYLGFDPLSGARWLNVVCLGLISFFSGLTLWRATASPFWSALAGILALTAYPIVMAHTMAWSEPLFLVLLLVGVLLLLESMRRTDNLILIAAASALGTAVTVRYAGFAAVLGGFAALLLRKEQPRRQTVVRALIFLAVSLAPVGIWLLRNHLFVGSGTNRTIVFHPIGTGHLNNFLNTLSSWGAALWQSAPEVRLLALIVTVALVGGCWLWDKYGDRRADNKADDRSAQVFWVSGCVALGYLLTLLLTISFLDYQTPLDSRMLSPLFLLFVLMGTATGCQWWRRHGSFAGSAIAMIPVSWCMASQIAKSAPWLQLIHDQGVGYSSRAWFESTLLWHLRKVDSASRIISNAPDVVYALLDRPSVMIPRKVHADTRAPNLEFSEQMISLKQVSDNKLSLIVIFSAITWRWYLPTAAELESLLGLQTVLRTDEGVIYRIN